VPPGIVAQTKPASWVPAQHIEISKSHRLDTPPRNWRGGEHGSSKQGQDMTNPLVTHSAQSLGACRIADYPLFWRQTWGKPALSLQNAEAELVESGVVLGFVWDTRMTSDPSNRQFALWLLFGNRE
jgi:hypothetical protein